MQGVYSYYESCIERETELALSIAGTQGGRIDVEEYIPGSEYAPFSNQLNFLGTPVPYWYHVSGNGLVRENVPTKSEIEREIGSFVASRLNNCNFEELYLQGFDIEFTDPEVRVDIGDSKVDVAVRSDLVVAKEEQTARKTEHSASVQRKFGRFYDLSIEIYDKERRDAVLEEYGIDVLRLYAPVDGVEISCKPEIWKTREVVEDIKRGLEANIASLKLEGNYFDLQKKENEYFVISGLRSDEQVNFMYSMNWPTKIEINGDGVDGELMTAEAVGNQEGLGILGFCYVPYHYVYDLSFPVLIQFYNNDELFQFPVAVIIDNNLPRNVEFGSLEADSGEGFDLCEFKEQDVDIRVFDTNLNPVDGVEIGFECFDQRCNLGETENGKFIGKAPACVNGFLKLRAEGFEEQKELFSSNSEVSKDVILDRAYDVNVELRVGSKEVSGNSIITFTKEGGKGTSAFIPEVSSVKLSEGQYAIRVYSYADSSITIPKSSKRQCTTVADGGILGFLGRTEEKCFDIEIPEQKIESALIGGGRTNTYILESQLKGGKIKLNVPEFSKPNSLEELQYNFQAFEDSGVDISFENE